MTGFEQQNVTVLGAGRSGIAAAKLLKHHGVNVRVHDSNRKLALGQLPSQLDALGIPGEFGADTRALMDSDTVILSPGIPVASPLVQDFLKNNISVISEIECAARFAKSPVIAITGSNGKTTTTHFTTQCLINSSVDAVACGNVGFPFSQAVLDAVVEKRTPVYVCEISSFQLETTSGLHAHAAVLLNITPDHLDRYPDFDSYARTKCRVFMNQTDNDLSIVNTDDTTVMAHLETQGRVMPVSREKRHENARAWFDEEACHFTLENKNYSLERKDIRLFGPHNDYNMMAGITACTPFVSRPDGIMKTLKDFGSLPHRLEKVAVIRDVTYYNDSKATNTDSVIMALRGIPAPRHLILGGRDKDSDFSLLAPYVTQNDTLYLIGEAAGKIRRQLSGFKMQDCGDLPSAVTAAAAAARPGDTVLLSPACASFDQYINYEERGHHFTRLVNTLKENRK